MISAALPASPSRALARLQKAPPPAAQPGARSSRPQPQLVRLDPPPPPPRSGERFPALDPRRARARGRAEAGLEGSRAESKSCFSQAPPGLLRVRLCVCVGGRFVCGCRFFPVLSPAPCPNAPRSWVEGLQNPWATAACKKKKSLSTFASRGKEVRLLARVALRGMVLLGYGPTAARHLYRRGGICGEKRPTERRRALPASVYSRLKQPEGSPLERREGTGVGVLEERGSRDAEGGWRRCGGRIRI